MSAVSFDLVAAVQGAVGFLLTGVLSGYVTGTIWKWLLLLRG